MLERPNICYIFEKLCYHTFVKEWCYHTFVKEWMKALDKTRILAPSDHFYNSSFPRYGHLKSKFLCEIYMEPNSSDML